MSNTLKLGIAGIRGIWGESLTAENAEQFARLFVAVTGATKIILGGDTRASHDELKQAIIAGLRKSGCHIVDVGVVPTPTLALAVRKESADGGVMMTASHNPHEWNGLKFFSAQGIFINPMKMNEIIDRYNLNNIPDTDKAEKSVLTKLDAADESHVFEVMHHIDVEKIKNKQFKVVIDMDNGAGTAVDPFFAEQLGLQAKFLFEKTDGTFERQPEPTPDALGVLSETVMRVGADIGFAQDPDADRLAIVDEQGNVLSEDYVLMLAMKYYLSQHPDPSGKLLVTNLSTSKMFDDIAHDFGCKVLRTKIGEVYVAEAIVEEDAIFGGEGSSAGVIWPDIGYVRDSLAGMALVLSYMAGSGKKVSELVAELPKYYTVKTKQSVANKDEVQEILNTTKNIFKDEDLDVTEGVKVNFENGWLHVRASNTEPIIRFFAEANTQEQAQQWIDQIKEQ